MYDSYGDGWNGNILMIGDIEYTLDSGSEGMTNVGETEEEEEIVEEGTTIFSDGSGGWPDEISWTIYNCDGEVMLKVLCQQSNVLNYQILIQSKCMIHGDGWNGNILMIGDIEYTLDSGSEGMTNVGCETEEEIVEEI